MFKTTSKIYAHISVINDKNYVLHDKILHRNENKIEMFHRYCPHRMFPLHNVGDHVDSIQCKFHGFTWDKNGIPQNNDRKLKCGTADIGRSGLIFKNFIEPDHRWVDELEEERNLKYSHCIQGKSSGSWLWLMDAEADYLHLTVDGVHPRLSKLIDLKDVIMDQGDDWILQEHSSGWWSLYIYPYTFIEHKKGCLSVNYVEPNNEQSEFGFTWITQFYYDSTTSEDERLEFETLEDVFREDVAAIEQQKGGYFPLMKSINKNEDHCIHFGRWYKDNIL
jgi:phenylpropionate dioxygenase-like ring-hydroxylating dioxygenase large terminal subunit